LVRYLGDGYNVHVNMRERNGQLPLAKRTGRSRISADIWEQIKTAYAAGNGLRVTARNMNIPVGTVLARAKREGWTQKIQHAKALVPSDMQSNAITPMQSAAVSMRERAERHVDRMAGVTEKVLPHLEAMPPDSILHRVDQVEKLDRIARRNYGLDSTSAQPGILNVAVLAGGKAMFTYNPQPRDPS
jgi:gluconate kinase